MLHNNTLEGLQSWVTKSTTQTATFTANRTPHTFNETYYSNSCQQFSAFNLYMLLLVIDFGLAHRLLSLCLSIFVQTYTCTTLMYATKWTGWMWWTTQAPEGPTLGSSMTHPLSVLASVPMFHLWNEHQKPCKPSTKQDMWTKRDMT